MLLENFSKESIEEGFKKIKQIKTLVRERLIDKVDYGISPFCGDKPSLYKSGAEKIMLIFGITSQYQLIDIEKDYEKGLISYIVKCTLYQNNIIIADGLGASNTREAKNEKKNPFSISNTVLKIAKKRAMVDAVLIATGLSDMFTQDIEDMVFEEPKAKSKQEPKREAEILTISVKQAKRLFAIAKDENVLREIINKFGYSSTKDIKINDYEKINKDLEARMLHNPTKTQ